MRPLWILRPEPGASASAARARALGLAVHVHPLFASEPLAWTRPESDFDALLLTSANAARLAGALPDLPVHAVGAATAEAARAAGARVVTVGSGGVDALLAALPPDLRLLHLSGEERIAPTAPRQAITVVPVYRTVPLAAPDPAALAGAVLAVHSPAAGRRIAALPLDRAAIAIAAISPAAAAACGEGWGAALAADTPDDTRLLSLAARLCKEAAS